jgi:uncharacterized membrane protein YqiK
MWNFVALLFGVVAVVALYLSARDADTRIADANERASAADERAAALEKEAADLRERAAKAEAETARLQAAMMPWRLNAEQQRTIADKIRTFGHIPFVLGAITTYDATFLEQMKSMLSLASGCKNRTLAESL